MNKVTQSSMIGFIALLVGLVFSGAGQAQCPTDEDTCVKVSIPEDQSKRPEVSKHVLNLEKTTDGQQTEFSFGLGDVEGTYYVIFKCQDEDPLGLDCRTPAVSPGRGDPVWVMRLNRGGVVGANVAQSLYLCDSCAERDDAGDFKYNDVEFKECKAKYCTYPYMVVDARGNRPPLDPDVVVDPR